MPKKPYPYIPYIDHLAEFGAFVFGGDAAFGNRGGWSAWFRERIGTAFNGRLIFEIGCAEAAPLCEIAGRFPDTAFVGLDWKPRSLYQAGERITKDGLRNVALLRARAQDVCRIFAKGEVDEIWVFHPDPCDKPAELKNRLFSPPFLADAHVVLHQPGSALCLKTDHPGYFQSTLALLGQPEPNWFQAARMREAAPDAPRIKVKEIVTPSELPERSDAVLDLFEVSALSTDFRNDPAVRSHTSVRCFAETMTPFEERFTRKRLPIYYLELARKV